jgi:hypothetical protein
MSRGRGKSCEKPVMIADCCVYSFPSLLSHDAADMQRFDHVRTLRTRLPEP